VYAIASLFQLHGRGGTVGLVTPSPHQATKPCRLFFIQFINEFKQQQCQGISLATQAGDDMLNRCGIKSALFTLTAAD